MDRNELNWEKVKENLKFTQEELAEIELEEELIKAAIKARKNSNYSQRHLSEKTGIKQSSIARIEKRLHSPTVNTLIRLLYPMGYTIKVVQLKEKSSKTSK